MKEISKYSRLASYLEKIYDKLNDSFFDGELQRPVITVQSSSKSYGHYTLYDAWSVKGEGYREINIAAGTLNRPIEYTLATMLHEMTHQYNDTILHIQDCSGSSKAYHNSQFRRTAEAHGLICTRSEKYGWSDTSSVLSDSLIDWILQNDVQEIKLTRNEPTGIRITGGNTAANGGASTTTIGTSRAHNFRYECPCCHAVARSGKPLNLICADCMQLMI